MNVADKFSFIDFLGDKVIIFIQTDDFDNNEKYIGSLSSMIIEFLDL